ncbi:MAG: YidB family protein [Phyllobacterium sp.]
MGIFDNAVPGGNISKPLLIALGALLVGKMFSGGASEPQTADPKATAPDPQIPGNAGQPAPEQASDGGLLGGLGGLLEKLTNAGHGETADSWVKPGDNKSIAPTDLGAALGKQAITEIAQRTGMSEEELLAQLSKVLPGVVDKLTADGQVPNTQQVASLLKTNG